MPQPPLPPKKDVAVALLQATSLFVHLDPRRTGVQVPAWFKKDPRLVLQFGMNMAVPIRDLHVGDEGIAGTLSFSRQPHHCFLPWAAIFAMVGEDGRGMVWPDDVPAELAVQTPGAAKPQRGHLRAVREGAEEDDSQGEGVPPEPGDAGDQVAEPSNTAPPVPEVEASRDPRAPERSVVMLPVETEPPFVPDAAGAEAPEPPPTPEDGGGERRSKRPPYLRVVK
jgi:stringent starvation protein B